MAKKKVKKKKSAAKPVTPKLSFEESMEQLQRIVAELEHGDLTLSESLDKYQRGVASLKQCHASLESAKKQIELLVDLDDQGNLVSQPFDASASVTATDNVRRSTDLPTRTDSGRDSATAEIEDFEPDDGRQGLF